MDRELSKEIGLRCKRIRQFKNMSQQELADLINTSSQNISKYERCGISNINVIALLSKALGCDLLSVDVGCFETGSGKLGE